MTVFDRIATASLVVTLASGCALDTSGLAPVDRIEDHGFFHVRPQHICRPVETAVASWSVTATIEVLAPCSFEIFGECIFRGGVISEPGGGTPRRSANISVFFNSTPTDPALAGVPPSENVGSRSLRLETDTTYEMAAIIERIGSLDVERRQVAVLEADNPTRIREETFSWGCTNAPGGAPGWSQLVYERGQLASDQAPIIGVRNVSGFPVHLAVTQNRDDESLPPLIRNSDLPAGALTTEFNGEYYGVWTVRPVTSGPFDGVTCDGGSRPGTLFVPAEGSPTIVPEPPPIVLQVEFGCTEFR